MSTKEELVELQLDETERENLEKPLFRALLEKCPPELRQALA